MLRQTVARTVAIEGTGLHRGNTVHLSIQAGKDSILFIRDGLIIPARPDFVVDTRLNTMLGSEGICISTVEHLMSALYGLGITDCEVHVDGDEIPSMDGSALPFFNALSEAGTCAIGEIDPFIIKSRLRVGDDNAYVEIAPGDFSISYSIDFPEPAIGRQTYIYSGGDYKALIAPARTFGRLKDVDAMRAMGLALGGSLENAIVVDNDMILNPEGLRFKDEFIRHKILDLLGDLWLLGRPVTGLIKAARANHRLHVELARSIWSCCVSGRE
jgi:UDP-3-O-[3-hydroxymyristoyl] N-acetylglucosamine deacetylase